MTASAGSGASGVGLAAAADGAVDGSVEAATLGATEAGATLAGAALGAVLAVGVEQAATANKPLRASPRKRFVIITPPLCSSLDVAVVSATWVVTVAMGGAWVASGVTDHLRSTPRGAGAGRARDGDGAPCPGLGLGRQDVDDVGRQQFRGALGGGAQARQLTPQGGFESIAGVGHAAPDDDALDVVGHHQQVDRPGEAAPDVVGQLARDGVAGGGRLVDLDGAGRVT